MDTRSIASDWKFLALAGVQLVNSMQIHMHVIIVEYMVLIPNI